MRRFDPRRSRAVLGLLVLASVTILTLDARHDVDSSPVDPLRTATAAVLGPVEEAAAEVTAPIGAIPRYFGDVSDLRRQTAELEAANSELLSQLRISEAVAHRAAELDGITALTDTAGFTTVNAEVVALGAAQSFSRTVTIDAGTRDGVVPDLTVINADGLVGRVLRAGPTTATVLLAIDSKSVIGGRLGSSMELGFLTGDGGVGADGSLQLSLVDHTISPRAGDAVVTWGSRSGAPYLAGIPVGQVVDVHSSPAELSETASVTPYVDFSSLDVVAVVTTQRPEDGR
jgi:rod shape-determining protein MreC